ETAAAARLYERHSSRVFGYCQRMLGSREDAEDASQTTFMQAHRALQRGVVPAFETAWLLTIAKNVCLARHRSGGRRKAVEIVRDPQDLEELAVGRELPDGTLMGLQDALARLPEMQRRAFLLREWQERSYAEIGAELGVTVPAVEALIFRARRALARDLRGDARSRRHAFDLASLLATIKSVLGGGAAVKLAVGAAAVVSAGAVVGATVQRGETPTRAPARAEQAPGVAPVAATRQPGVETAFAQPGRLDRTAVAEAQRQAGGPKAPMPATPGAPAAPAAPSVAPVPGAPEASLPEGPSPPSVGSQPVPAVPAVPAVPPPPVLPDLLPDLPPTPPLPVEVPPVPTDQLPVPVPEIPEVPGVPDLPILP
ncbi:MAG: RNA polymerase sigma factor, partial [Actinomycetota bacterium]|nr:RNA polymerase sigma factor [Actinomycetota bacterium]